MLFFSSEKVCRQANEGTPWVEFRAIKDITSGDAGSTDSESLNLMSGSALAPIRGKAKRKGC